MKLSAFLSPSRHGVYYFRWPLPSPDRKSRRTVRISLRTKCPDRAGDLARHLASCGRLVRDNKALARLRQDEMRDLVRSYFAASLDRYVERLNDTGLPDRSLEALRQELAAHEDAAEGHEDLSDMFLDPDAFRASAGLTDEQWAENAPSLRHEMRKARRDQIREFLSRAESHEGYSFNEHAQTAPKPSQARSASLSAAIADFKAEHGPQWSQEMFMSFTHNTKEGYGRNLGRWFGTFLTKIGMKEDGLVFHSLRHTAITRMRQASVELSLVQEIVGHERDTVTDGYFGEGYTLPGSVASRSP